jgi:hypothetical protein
MLRSEEELAAEGGVGGPAAEGFFGGEAGEIGIVVFLREMRENEISRARVKAIWVGEIFADSVIR